MAGRARPNTVKAYAHDLKVFFAVVAKEPEQVTSRDVMAFVTDQRRGRAGAENVVRITDTSAGLSAATIKRRLAAVSALYGYLVVRGDVGVTANPVPHGLPTRQHRHRGPKVVPLVRGCGVCPASWSRPRPTGWWGHCARNGTGRSCRRCCWPGCGVARCWGWVSRTCAWASGVSSSPTARAATSGWCRSRRRSSPPSPPTSQRTSSRRHHDRLFVALKGPTRGGPLSASGFDEVLTSARRRAGLTRGTCHELRHTCFTRLRQAGMAIEALQALAGHRSITSTRVYLHLGDDWLAQEYRREVGAIDIATDAGTPR